MLAIDYTEQICYNYLYPVRSIIRKKPELFSSCYKTVNKLYVENDTKNNKVGVLIIRGAMRERAITEVVAALIWRGDKFLICQRPANKARGLLWEFVGGKVEEGETKEQALVRECREELAITVKPHDIFTEVTHRYPDITVHLTLFNCSILRGQPQLLEHNALKWITPAEIADYDFCPADVEILKKLELYR